MPARENVARRNLGPALSRRPVSECPFQLTASEKKLLKDPDWIDEEEADLILAMREEREYEPGDSIPLREHIRRHGFHVKD